jgi:hypothetical protein
LRGVARDKYCTSHQTENCLSFSNCRWIGGGEGGGGGIHETFGSFATHGYMYGREWLAGQVQSVLGDTSEKGSAIEKQVLNLYDQLYQSYVLANSTTASENHFGSGLTNSGDLLNEMQIIVMENLETVVSVSTCISLPSFKFQEFQEFHKFVFILRKVSVQLDVVLCD